MHQREVVQRVLAENKHNLAAAARSLGMDRGNFHRLVKRLGLKSQMARWIDPVAVWEIIVIGGMLDHAI